MQQSKKASFAESMANTLIGYVINLLVQLAVYPLYGATFTLRQNIELGLVFMAVSIVRGYVLRRSFNALLHRKVS